MAKAKTALGVLTLLIALHGYSSAQTPVQQVQATIERITTIVGSSSGSAAERREAVKKLLLPRFDWHGMARQSLGNHWPSMPAEQHEFVATFTQFIGNSYIGHIGSYKDEKIIYLGERPDKDSVQVDTKLVPADGDPVSVTYRLRQLEGEWKIYDVIIDDISLVNNYRSQFSRILAKKPLQELVKQLKAKDSERN